MDESDLFSSLDEAAKEDQTLDEKLFADRIISSWSDQNGYPLVRVERDYVSNTLIIRQSKHLSNETTTWWIPYNYATPSNPNFGDTSPDGWLSQREKFKIVSGSWQPNEWVVFNKQQTSFYRVLYDETNYQLIRKQLLNSENFTAIHELSRSQILDDLIEFVDLGYVNVTVLLDFLPYLKHETEYPAWMSARKALLTLNKFIAGTVHHNQFRSLMANITENFFIAHGLDDPPHETPLQMFSRNAVANLACRFGLEKCLFATRLKFKEGIENDFKFPPSTKSILLNGIRNATAEELELLWQHFHQSKDGVERSLISIAFGNIENIELLHRYLAKTVREYPEDIDPLWRSDFIQSAAENSQIGLKLCIEFVRNYSSDLLKTMRQPNLNADISDLAELIVTDDMAKEVGFSI